MKTNLENYEERFVDYMEGQLDPTEMREVEAFVAQHPELEEDFRLFGISKLTPDTTITYPRKDALMQPQRATRIPLFVKIVSVAASIALLIGIGFWFLKPDPKTGYEIPPLITDAKPIKITKIEVPEEPFQPKSSTLRSVAPSTPKTKKAVFEEPIRLDEIPTLDYIKTGCIQWETASNDEEIANRMNLELANRLAALEPYGDLQQDEDGFLIEKDGGLLAALKDNLWESAQNFTMTLYKRTAKSVLTAYYTADCYINETRERLTEDH